METCVPFFCAEKFCCYELCFGAFAKGVMMASMLTNMEEILSRQISGFHQYIFNGQPRLGYVSRNLCEMTGFSEEELLCRDGDGYRAMVHPDDREAFDAFLGNLAEGEQTLSCGYRLVKKDGTTLQVRDTASSRELGDGSFAAYSVLDDITGINWENCAPPVPEENIPCGFMKYTCEKQPRVLYMNQTMMEILRFPEPKAGELDYLELCRSNIFLMVPMEERRRFSEYLQRVYRAEGPIAGEMALLRCDGTRAHVMGWVTKGVNSRGEAEFQSVCMDITHQRQARKDAEASRYLEALAEVYDKIFEFNLEASTVKCLHCEDVSSFKQFEGVAMQMEEALEKWILQAVAQGDREEIRRFFADFCRKKFYEPGAKPPQLAYQALSSDGEAHPYIGIFIKVDEATSFYCCRHIQESGDAAALRRENDQLKTGMKDLVTQFTDGLAAFEVTAEGLVKPLYASENVREFFGYTKDEWLPLMERATPLESFTAYSEAAYGEFTALLENGEAEFSYFDHQTKTERRIRAICSQRAPRGDSPRYVMLYSVEGGEPGERNSLPENRGVSIRTFGYFDVFVGERPIAFRNKKAKELFALLVDRRGGYVTSEEAISFLWEEEPVNTVTLSRYRKVALRLKNTLEEYGISNIMESVDGKRRIVPERVKCDLYDYLSGGEAYAQLFRGSYLTNYSWGEMTLGELCQE